MMRKVRGISLLEMLLVIAIGAAIIMAAVRYFSVTSRDLNATHAIQQVQMLTKASYEWLEAQKQENFGDTGTGTAISLQQLIDADLIENKNSDTKDPWGGAIAIAPGSDPSRVKITLPDIPKKACKNLARRLNGVSKTSMPTCNSKKNDYTGEF